MLIVISDAVVFKDEALLINALFDEGMEHFHLRKTAATASAYQQLLEQVNPDYWSNISLHAHHQMAGPFKIKRLHYTGQKRKESDPLEWQVLKQKGFVLSTSTHLVEEAENIAGSFDYAFLSPVFNSISKLGYHSMMPQETKLTASGKKLIALGGIKEDNMELALQMGFSGVAVLGAVWQSQNPATSFRKIINKWNSIVL